MISVNFVDGGYPADACFVSNHKRMDILGQENRPLKGTRILLTSNIPNPGWEDYLYVDYDRYTNTDPMISDNAGLMLLKLLQRCGALEVFLAGFDGFQEDQENYYSEELYFQVNTNDIEEKRGRIQKQLKEMSRTMKLYFLTPSLYQGEEAYV